MQKDNRGTMASLTPQIGSPRPFSTWDLQGSAGTTARHADGGGRGAPPQIPSAEWSWLADLGREAIVPLLSPCYAVVCARENLQLVVQSRQLGFVSTLPSGREAVIKSAASAASPEGFSSRDQVGR